MYSHMISGPAVSWKVASTPLYHYDSIVCSGILEIHARKGEPPSLGKPPPPLGTKPAPAPCMAVELDQDGKPFLPAFQLEIGISPCYGAAMMIDDLVACTQGVARLVGERAARGR